MPLFVGTKLGPYEILAPIGAGGMGEVWKARDTKLDREVAIKVLPAALAQDPERLARFEREAKVLASLNHPNIAQIYGIEESSGVRALVMELVPGQTLRGPLPLTTALNYAEQIADALEAAHEKAVTHRDLKPANIMITPTGVVKVLDFGLAAVGQASAPGDGNPTNSPTLTMRATQAGMIMGTAAYMSPEQASGKPVDKRADIWAFGVVLWEMLTGQQLFTGETISHVLAAVLTKEPDIDRVPARAQRLLRSCLQKDTKQRLQAIGDWRLLLEDAPVAKTAPSPSRLGKIWPGVAALATVALAALAFIHFRETPPLERTLRYTIAAPENSTVHSFAVSPDGRYVAIAAAVQGKRQLWLRALDALQSQPMPGTEDARFPFWSPDSRYIGFFAQGKLKKIAATGGPAQSLCDAANALGGTWSRDDVIMLSIFGATGIQRVPASGGVPTDVTKPKGFYRSPLFLPDGRRFLYVVIGAAQEHSGVYVSSLDGKENRRVLADVSSVLFAAGHLLFTRENTLMAQPFDAGRGQLLGDAFPIAEGVSFTSSTNSSPVSVSENGVLLYGSGGAIGDNQIVWYDRTGKLLGPVGAPGNFFAPSISPSEKMIAFSRLTAGVTDIWLRDLVRGTDIRFTSNASQNFVPFWSPQGDHIVFRSYLGGHAGDLYQKAASGSGQDELLVSTPNDKTVNQWSRNGQFIVYSELDPKTKWDLWVFPVGDRKPIRFLNSDFNELQGQMSPDGRWMAYTSDESGQREVYVRPFPASDGIWRISTAGGEQARWRGDGKELFFVGADGKMTAVAVKASAGAKPSFEAGAPVPLFEARIAAASSNVAPFQYDVTADGKRFLVDTYSVSASALPLTVVVNWTAGLRK